MSKADGDSTAHSPEAGVQDTIIQSDLRKDGLLERLSRVEVLVTRIFLGPSYNDRRTSWTTRTAKQR